MSVPSPASKPKERSGALRRTVRDFLDLFLERWWIGAIVGVIAGVSYVVFQPHHTPVYQSEATLLFETQGENILNMRGVQELALRSANELNTHMEQLRSKTFYDYFVNSFTKEEQEKIQEPYRDPLKPDAAPPDINSIILSGRSVYARKGTSIVGISIINRSPQMAAFIANRMASQYIAFNNDRAKTTTNSNLIFLRQQEDEIRDQVAAAEKEWAAFRQANSLTALVETQNQTLVKSGKQKSELTDLQLDLIKQKALLNRIEEKKKEGIERLFDIPEIVSYGSVGAYRAELDALRIQRAILDDRYGRGAKQVKDNELRKVEATRALNENIERANEFLQAKYEDSSKREARLKEEIAETEISVRNLDRLSTENRNLETKVNTLRASYGSIKGNVTERSISSQLDRQTMIKTFDTAFAPGAPTNDGVGAVTAKAIAVGGMALFLLPLAIGFFDTRIRSPLQIEDGLGEPLLGTVKPMPKMSASERANIYRLQKDPALAESYRGIYSEIEVRSTLLYPKTLVLTSSVPQEGKSQLSCNLAAVFASHKRKTLLVDCDLRRPTLHRYFGLKVDTGWVNWIEQPATERSEIPFGIINMGENLDLLPAGRMPGNPTEVLDRLANRAVIEPLLKSYDLVIFDTPPIGIFPDAVLLSRACHEAVFVCRYRTVRIAPACKNIDRLHEAGIVVLGVVLNQLPEAKARAYGYEGYGAQAEGYYRAYKSEEKNQD